VTVRPGDAVVRVQAGLERFYYVSGNRGVIDTHNSFDLLDATDGGWEYQPYELAGSRKRPKRRRKVLKCAGCACSVCSALGICALVWQAAEQGITSGTPLRRRFILAGDQSAPFVGLRRRQPNPLGALAQPRLAGALGLMQVLVQVSQVSVCGPKHRNAHAAEYGMLRRPVHQHGAEADLTKSATHFGSFHQQEGCAAGQGAIPPMVHAGWRMVRAARTKAGGGLSVPAPPPAAPFSPSPQPSCAKAPIGMNALFVHART
jgi:hypothetical protein